MRIQRKTWRNALLVGLIAALALWLGATYWTVHARRAYFHERQVLAGNFSADSPEASRLRKSSRCLESAEPTASGDLSTLRRLMGDQPSHSILVFDEKDFRQATALFPEAFVAWHSSPPGLPDPADAPPAETPSP